MTFPTGQQVFDFLPLVISEGVSFHLFGFFQFTYSTFSN